MKHFNLKKICFFLILILVTGGTVFAQGYNTTNWKFSNPKQFGFTVLDVDYFDNNNAIAVGSNGGIAKSTDGGRNWTYGVYTYINPGGFKVTANFNDVHYVTASVAYAVASNGAMAKTTDGGATWNFVTTPLLPNLKNINACWFLDANKGYIGGDVNNNVDSIPRLYVTLNGGATWDSITPPPVNGVSRVGYNNNPLIPSVLWPVDAKLKSIFRIEFINDSTGYVSGSNSYGVSLFPIVSFRATSPTVCTPLATTLTSGSMAASLLWKFKSGVLTDYSLSKERIGYTGINTTPLTCQTTFANVTPVTQQYRAMNIYNDSTVVLMSFNNNTVVKVYTGKNDSTANVNAPGIFEKGKYEVLNFPFPPTQGPNAGPPIPNPQVLLASNPYQMRKTANGTLIVNGNFGRMHRSVDTGRNWIADVTLPQGQNYSGLGVWGMDIAPNGRVLSLGTNGVMADSLPGSSWQSNYLTTPLSASYNDMEFTDCNNGIAAGGSAITVTNDGGNTWIDRNNAVLGALFANITHLSYVNPTKVYFTTSIGNIYRSANQGVNLSPVFAEPLGGQINDIAWAGNDSLWAVGFSSFSVPAANRQGKVYRSFNNAATWDTIPVGPVGTLSFTPRAMDFPTRSIGYICGSRNYVYKTTDAGATWTDVSPFPALTPQLTYTAMQALNKDTIFIVGVGFPRKAVYRTTDGGATWTDITGNILTLGVGNLNGILMHDINNGYVMTPGGALLVTTNGGTSWTLDIAPTQNLFTTAAFVPRSVGPGVNMVNRKMLVSGPNISGAPIMEYGNPANTQVNSTELITGAACSTPNSGSITITATGGLAPYQYRLNAGPFQASNVFSGLAAGTYTITIRDAYCGLLTKTVTIALNDDQILNTNITTATICAGGSVQLIASGNSTTYSWSPVTGLSNPNIANPIASPTVTTTYTVTGTLNSCIKTRTITVNVLANSPLVIVADPGTTICEGDPTLLTVYNGTGGSATIPLPAQAATFTGNVRGYWFTAPSNFTMTGIQVPTTASAGNQSIAVVRFNPATPPPAFPGTTNAFTTLFLTQNNPAAGSIPVNIPIAAGDVIGIMGYRATVNSYSANGPQTTTINGTPVTLTRMGMQFPLTTTAPQNIWQEAAFGISRVEFTYSTTVIGTIATGTFLWSPALGLSSTTSNPVAASPMNTTTYKVIRTTVPDGCRDSATITINVNKRPVVTAQPTNTVRCVGNTATFTVGGTGTGLTYQWQLNTAGCGGGGTWTNLTNLAPYSGVTTATLTVNPVSGTMSGYGYRCVLSGTCTPFIPPTNVSNCATLTVNPNPNIAITPVGPVCGGVMGLFGTALNVTSAAPPVPGNASANSGVIAVPIPDGSNVAATSNLTIAGIPANATLGEIRVNMNINHTWVGDVDVSLRAPNLAILNLVGSLNGGTGGNAGDNFTNTTFSSLGGTPISGAPDPRTGTFAAEARVGFGPIGFIQAAAATWANLAPPATPLAANGVWTLAAGDKVLTDVGTITNWSISIDYTTPGSGTQVLTYAWSPLAGLYTNTIANIPYAGTNLTTVYAAPTVQTTYTVRATDVATGCFSDASVLVNYTPPPPTITPSSVTMCLGDPAVRLVASSSTPGSATFSSGTVNVAIPDGPTIPPVPTSYPASVSNITVAGIPAGATITAVRARFNVTHAWVSDLVIALKAPNGQIVNLSALLNRTNQPGANFTNTVISSTSTTALGGAAPYTGTFADDAAGATFTALGFTFPGGPVGYVPTTVQYADLYNTGTTNGVWSLGIYDAGAPDAGTLNNWSLDIDYVVGVVASGAIWTPNGVGSGLFNDAAASSAYIGDRRDTVWARPTPIGANPYQVTVNNMISFAATPATPMAGGNGNNLISFNVRNNNAFPVTLAGISSNAFGSGAVAVRSFYKVTGNAGNPGPITAANGFVQFGTSNVTVTANTLNPVLTGLTLTIPAGATYAIALDYTGATFPAYTNGAATTVTYTNNGCDIITGGNVGWGGPAAPGTPVNNPRNFNGTVTFLVSGPGTCVSPPRTVIVTVNQPTVINANIPVNQTICTDKVATFSAAVVSGTGPHSYQWQVSTNSGVSFANVANGGVYSGATTATLTITAPPVSMSNYQYRCIITGAAPCAAQTSRVATLVVNPLPVIVISATAPRSLFPGLRSTFTSTVTPNPAGPGGYSWIRNGVVLSNPSPGVVSGLGTGSIIVDVDGQGDYQLRVTDVNGCTNISNTVTIKDSLNGKCFIYPNPTSGKFQVRYHSVANNVLPRTLTINDAKGDRVFTQRYTIGFPYDRMEVDLRGFGKGMYWVEIGDLNGNRLAMCRVVVQ